ncbi:MAG: conserved rane protein of unknown function [Bacteroidetes bacterium]|nr:conserved rane protein of unknown function [Bacteroidota bacterium]
MENSDNNAHLAQSPDRKRSSQNYALLVLPLVFCLLWLYCYYQSKTFFCTYPDSTYIYLINGTNIASGNSAIGHFDNPGTPVHLLGALVIYIVHLFSGKGIAYEDVLADPEFYLRFCAGTFGLLLLLSIYLSARFILKHTGNLLLALFFQLLPVCSFFTVHYLLLVRMCPENLIIAVLLGYYAFLWVLCYKRDKFPESAFSRRSHLLLFSFVSALLVTTKMTCLPFLIIPLFFLPKFSQKAWYALLTLVLGAIMIYPIWPKLPEMYNWFTRLATHSGRYGQGAEGVSADTLTSNLVKLFQHDLFFSAGYFILIGGLITGLLKKKQKENFYRLMLGAFIVCTVQLALASKQFGYHYLIASQMLIIPALAAMYYVMDRPQPRKAGYVLFGLCLAIFGFKVSEGLRPYKETNKIYESSLEAKKYKDVPKIITTGFQGACFIESGIRFGASYGGGAYHNTNFFLRRQYPNSYFYDIQEPRNLIWKWDMRLSPEQFFVGKPQVLVYFIQMQESEELNVLKKITAGLDSIVKNIRLEKYNEATGERFYMLEIDTVKARPHYAEALQYKYDFEKQDDAHSVFLSSPGSPAIGEATLASTEKHVSGMHSIKIPPGQYTCCTSFDAAPGDAFDISVKSHTPDRPIGITLSGVTHPEFFDNNCEVITSDAGDGWQLINLKAVVPVESPLQKVNFCLYYFGYGAGYADDLNITICKSNKVKEEPVPAGLAEVRKFILKASGGNYIALGEGMQLAAIEPDAAKAEVFEKVELADGSFALKASNGMFVCDVRNKGSVLVADRKEAREWESFRFIGTGLSAVNIKSSYGMFVCADHSTDEKLSADKIRPSTWETFELIKK